MAPTPSILRNFKGVLTRIGLPSDRAPNGARGHRVILTKEAVEDALETIKHIPVGFGACWSIHNVRQRCGIITEGEIVGNELHVKGRLFAQDYPEVITMMEKGKLGMSYELADAKVDDMAENVWVISKFTFSGAAILYPDKAAYGTTCISLAAAAELAEEITSLPDERQDAVPFEFTLANVVWE